MQLQCSMNKLLASVKFPIYVIQNEAPKRLVAVGKL